MMQKICVVMPGYHFTVHNFCNKLSDYFDVFLLLPSKLCPNEIPGRNYSFFKISSLNILSELPVSIDMIRIIQQVKPDIIIAGEDFQPNTILISLFQRHFATPIIVINHKYFLSRIPYLKPLHRIIRTLFTKPIVWRFACKMIPRTNEARKFMLKSGAAQHNLRMVPMGIDVPNRDEILEVDAQQLKFITVGRLIPLKGFQYILDATRILKNKGITINLTIVGDGPYRNHLRTKANNLGLNKQVVFIDQLSHSELLESYRDYQVYLQPSSVEVVGLAALEALASGCALIVSNIGGLKDVVDHGINGFTVPTRNPRALADAMEKMLQDTSRVKEMQIESLRKAQNMFSWNLVIQKYVELIIECIDKSIRKKKRNHQRNKDEIHSNSVAMV